MRRDVFARRINVDVASHSPQMDPLLEPLREALAGIAPCAARLPFYSSVDAGIADGGTALDADYWTRNMRSTVRFGAVVQQLLAGGPSRSSSR